MSAKKLVVAHQLISSIVLQCKAYIEAFTDLLTSSAALGAGLSLPNEFTVSHHCTSMERFAQVHFFWLEESKEEHGFCEVKLCLALQSLIGKAMLSTFPDAVGYSACKK